MQTIWDELSIIQSSSSPSLDGLSTATGSIIQPSWAEISQKIQLDFGKELVSTKRGYLYLDLYPSLSLYIYIYTYVCNVT